MSYRQIAAGVITCLLSSGITQAQNVQNKRETQVRQDKSVFEKDDTWIYGELDLAREIAAKEKKPLMVVFRCVP